MPSQSFDPVEVAALQPAAVEAAVAAALAAVAQAADLDQLKTARLQHAGDRSPLALANREIAALPPAARSAAGQRVGAARATVNQAIAARQVELERERDARVLVDEAVDVTLPTDRVRVGARHPLTTVQELICDVFLAMGWEVAEGPEAESTWFNFDALNTPAEHPSRELSDTFYIGSRESTAVLRTQTSPVQVRAMLERTPPIYIVCPGKVFRTDELDATHTPVFHQLEGLAIDRGLTMAHLKGTLDHMAAAMFGAGIATRLRPHFFPFTEPSAEIDLVCFLCRGQSVGNPEWDCRACNSEGWIEWGGCGMVDPRVLAASGVDAERYSGFAFGMGMERTLMFRNAVADMRDIVEGDVRFTAAFGVDACEAPLSWLVEYVDVPRQLSARALADALIRIGMEVESVSAPAEGITGPIVVGRVVEFADEPQKNGKTIRWCQVDVGADELRGIVCGAHNFAAGDLVVVALPGAVLPGRLRDIGAKTYGHISDGMICSARELGIGEDHTGILVLPAGVAVPGEDGLAALGMRDTVLDIAVTTDRGYCLSIRGLAREAAAATGSPFSDIPAQVPAVDGGAYAVRIDDPSGCDRFSARAVTGLNPASPTPEWMVRRLRQCGMRSISLPVDVTNYVMLETGQPLHAFDRAKLSGPITVRRAAPGEKLITLDDVARTLDPDDMVVCDDTGPIALAGVMGGASTEIGPQTADVVLEAAHWDPDSIARTVRRHRLPSEAARRFERNVDPEIAVVALARCVELLVEYGGASAAPGFTVVGTEWQPPVIALDARYPEQVAGMPVPVQDVVAHLTAVGCTVSPGEPLMVTPPTWRPDLVSPADLAEEVVRLAGYDRLPSVLPAAPAGRGLTPQQRLHRGISRAVAAAGYTEVLSYPFVSPAVHDRFGLAADDRRRRALRLVNPISEDEPELRTSLLPGLIATALRNLGRGNRDLALFEVGAVFLPKAEDVAAPPPLPGVAVRPTPEQVAALDAALPDQPRHLAVLLCGHVEARGWQSPGRAAEWTDAVEAARVVARTARAHLEVRAADVAPWHPGRCAELLVDGSVIGHAGELHPRVVAAFGLPERSCAMEVNLEAFPPPAPATPPQLSTFPPVLLDVALVVPVEVPAADVERTVATAAGPLLESIHLFDVFADDERLGPGLRSLAYSLRFRAPDRTLTVEEATAARNSAVDAAAQAHGAQLRS